CAGILFNAPHVRRDAALFENLDEPNLASSCRVGATAEFSREVANPDNAYLVTVFLAEQGHGFVFVDGNINRDVFDNLNFFVSQDFLVDDVFDILQFLVSNRCEMREVESQMIRGDQGPGLFHVFAQHFAQSGVEKVGGGVIPHGGFAEGDVHYGIHLVADMNGLLGDQSVCTNSLNGVIAAGHFGNDGVVVVAVEPS